MRETERERTERDRREIAKGGGIESTVREREGRGEEREGERKRSDLKVPVDLPARVVCTCGVFVLFLAIVYI